MRDLDSELTGLRNALRDSIDQPATEDMIKRGRRRVRRQQAQVAAVVAIIVAVGVWPFLQMPESAAPAVPQRSYVLSHDYFDATSGFALGRTCRTAQRHCDPWFVAISDGQTWVKRAVPPIEITDTGYPDRVIALGTSKVVLEDWLPDDSVDRYYSNDGARTWSAVSDQPNSTIQEIPQDAALETKNGLSDGGFCRDGSVIAMLDSGRSAKLASQPPIQSTWCQPYPDLNGTRWVAGNDPRTRQPVVASTRDRGRTWQVTPLPALAAATSYYPKVTVVSTPAASYATVTNPDNAELVAIFRSADHGVSWTRTWQASDGKQPTRVQGTPIAGPDGHIRIIQPDNVHVWASTDGAKTFTMETQRSIPASGMVGWLRTGYLLSSPDSASSGQFFLSHNGISWRIVRIPIPE
jgi:hypothetical protein